MCRVIMAAAFDLFDLKVNTGKFAGGAQNAETLRQNLGPNAIAGQSDDVIGLFHCFVKKS